MAVYHFWMIYGVTTVILICMISPKKSMSVQKDVFAARTGGIIWNAI